MQFRSIGSSTLNVSTLAFGAWQIGDETYWGAPRQSDYDAVVHAALDMGITLFDTAEMYGDGESERALGRALHAHRQHAVIASKLLPGHCAPEDVRTACENSLKRLGTEWIDLYQVHWPNPDIPFEATYGALERLREEGKIRAIGVSNFGPRDLNAWMRHGAAVSNQLGYNLLFRAIEHEIVPACQHHGLGILVYMPLLQGLLSGRWKNIDDIPQPRRRTRHFCCTRPGTRHGEAGCETQLVETLEKLDALARELGHPLSQVATAWLLAQPGVTSVIVGTRDIEQVRCNAAAAGLHLAPDILLRLDTATQRLKEHFGANADLWMDDAHSRIR